MEQCQQEGTIGFYLPEAEDGWRTDNRHYALPTLHIDRFRVELSKSEDRKLTVRLLGLSELPVSLQAPLPDGTDLLYVMVMWRNGVVQLYVDHQSMAVVQVTDPSITKRSLNN